MVAATVTEYVETFDPTTEEALLEATDAETYTCRKLAVIKTVQITINSDNDGAHNATWSGAVVTLNLAGMTDQKVSIRVKGTL